MQSYAAQIVERHIFDALNQEKNATIDRWLAALPTASGGNAAASDDGARLD